MGIGLLIALVAGLMARNLLRQRAHLGRTLTDVRRIDVLRSRLVAMLAHDVRSPLTTIRGTFSTLHRHGHRLAPGARDELIRSADREAERLERLASDLLALARLESGRLDLHLQETVLRDVIDRALSFADPDHRFEIHVGPDVVVWADPARLEQIVVNLATNALRYGHPPFVVEARDGVDSLVDLLFLDHGPGVPEAQRGSPVRAVPVRARPELGRARPGHRPGSGGGAQRRRAVRAEPASGSLLPGVASGGRPRRGSAGPPPGAGSRYIGASARLRR